jgi:hypothetical protein
METIDQAEWPINERKLECMVYDLPFDVMVMPTSIKYTLCKHTYNIHILLACPCSNAVERVLFNQIVAASRRRL